MIAKKYRAKDIDTGKYYEGYYFEYPETTYCFKEDYERHPPRTIHCLATHRMSDWGLPNIPVCVEIDPSTLEDISDVVAEKVWTKEDIRGMLRNRNIEGSDENVKKVIETGYLRSLEEATDSDWDIIDYAIDAVREYDD